MNILYMIKQRPLVLLTLGAVCISFSPIFIHMANVAPDTAGFYRMFFGGTALLIILIVKKEPLMPNRSVYPYLALTAVLISIDFYVWHRSIHRIGPGLSTIIGNFQVFFTAAIAAVFFKTPITVRLVIAMLGAMSGVLMITGVDMSKLSGEYQIGLGFAFATAFFYSLYLLTLKKLVSLSHGLSGMGIMMVISLSSAALLSIVTSVGGESFVIPNMKSFGALMGVGILGQVIGWVLISMALEKVSAPIAGLILLLQPALAFVWDVLFFDRSAFSHEIFGLCIMLTAIYVGSTQKQKEKV